MGDADPIRRLRRAAWKWLSIGLAFLASCYVLLEAQSAHIEFAQWLLLPFIGTLALWRFLVAHLNDNRRVRDGRLLPRFGLGNNVSILRGLELIMLSGFLLIPRPQGWTAWIPALLYTSADILDYVDGYVARVRDEVTGLGEELDQLFDGAGLLIATLLAMRYGTLTWWFFPFGAARFLFLLGLWIRKQRGLPVHPLTESRSRRPIAGLTMGFMTAMLWPIVKPPASILAGLLFMLPFGASFLRDWLVVSGAIDPRSERYLRLRSWLETTLIGYLPVIVRFSLAGLLVFDAWMTFGDLAGEVTAFAQSGFSAPDIVVPLFAAIKLLAIPMLVLGAAGRFVAFMLVFPIGLTIVLVGFTDMRAGLLVLDLLTLVLGTGRFSLWQPSNEIFGRRAGG